LICLEGLTGGTLLSHRDENLGKTLGRGKKIERNWTGGGKGWPGEYWSLAVYKNRIGKNMKGEKGSVGHTNGV